MKRENKMEHIIEIFKQEPEFYIGTSCTKEEITHRLILLNACDFTPPPLEYLQFLTKLNGIHSQDAKLYGCYELSNNIFLDFVDKNLLLDRNDKKCIIILGENIMDYLAYNNNNKIYETRDKQTDEVTFTFNTLEDALSYFFDLEE